MLVSVVVPVYNVERYLRECLDSLRDQTLEDIEIICVNDGSTDGSLDILREYEAADARFKVLTKPNAGYGHTMNRGFEAASAPYVAILESDDFCTPDMCEKLYRTAVEHDADIVRCNINLYWSTPYERRELVPYSQEGECGRAYDPREERKSFLLPPALCCMLVRRSLIVDNGLRFLETPGGSFQDTSFSFKLWACAKRAVRIPDAFISYRQDNEASSINQPDKAYCVPREYEEVERFILSDEARFGELLPLMVRRKFGAYVWNYERIAPQFHREFAELMARELNDAAERGLIDEALFSASEWYDLRLLRESPAKFVERMDEWSRLKVRWKHGLARLTRR